MKNEMIYVSSYAAIADVAENYIKHDQQLRPYLKNVKTFIAKERANIDKEIESHNLAVFADDISAGKSTAAIDGADRATQAVKSALKDVNKLGTMEANELLKKMSTASSHLWSKTLVAQHKNTSQQKM